MKAVIMAGGQGTRLRSVSGDLPKPMVPVLGKPVLAYQIECLRKNDIEEIFLIIGYRGEAIREYFGDGSSFGVRIRYFCEEQPLGTAGALYYLKEDLGEDFLLLMGDLMLDVDFRRFARFHRECGGLATLFVHPNAHPYDSDIIVTDTAGSLGEYGRDRWGLPEAEGALGQEQDREQDREPEWEPDPGRQAALRKQELLQHARVRGVLGKKEERTGYYHNQVNAGIYALSKRALQGLREGEKCDLDREVIRPLMEQGAVYAYRSTEYVKDMGTPERYESVSRDLSSGLTAARNLSCRQKCIFLDRDGTVNRENGFISSPEDLSLLPGAAEAIRRINASEYLCILVTNQPVVARGECSFAELDRIHAKLETELGKEGAYLDDLFFCPHHQDRGFAGEVPELKFVCSCRKPRAGMLLAAAEKYNIDLTRSVMIGDSPQDMACGQNGGTRRIFLGDAAEAGDPGIEAAFPDLLSAVEFLLA